MIVKEKRLSVQTLATIAVKVPQAVFCLLTALQIHELTTQLSRQIWIAMPQGSHTPKIDYPPGEQTMQQISKHLRIT